MHVTRLVTASIGAAALSIALSGVAGAATGQTGNHLFVDSLATPGVVCHYSSTAPNALDKLTIKAPQVWWPDTSSNSNTQHGTVGWQAFIYHKGFLATTWKLLKKSTVHKATAYEGYPGAYDLADKAPFSNISMSVPGSNYQPTHEWRVRVKVYWYSKLDGSVMGSDSHLVLYYKFGSGSTDVRTDYCASQV
jgi:hypothetical protein